MKKLLLLHLTLLLSTFSMAQVPNFEWVHTLGDTSFDRAQSVVVDKSGNVYTTGYFQGKVDFDSDTSKTYYLTSNGGYDIFISKLDNNKKLLWAINIGEASNDAGNSIKLDVNGDVYVTGYFMDKVDFDPSKNSVILASAGSKDIFVSKFDASGNFVWASRMGGSGEDVGNSLAIDAAGDIITTGYFEQTSDFDPGTAKGQIYNLTSYGALDIFISRLDGKGNFVWAVQMGGTSNDAGNSVSLDSFGYIYNTGYFTDKADFIGATLYSIGDADIYVARLNAKGAYSWAVPAGDKAEDIGMGIIADATGNSYITGYFYGAPDFNPGTGKGQVYTLTSNGDVDIFVWKLDVSGAFVWAKNIGGKGPDAGTSITLDASKNVYTTGVFYDVVDFDPGSGTQTFTSNGKWDVFISKLTNSGNYDWALSIGEGEDDGGTSITIDKIKSVYVAGAYSSQKMDFDPNKGTSYESTHGVEDGFTLKLAYCKASSADVTVKACNSYTYNGTTYYKNGNYVSTLKNSTGCDSIVTLKLTLYSTTFNNIEVGACDKYTINGETYTKEGTYTQSLKNVAGCDSFLIIDLKFLTSTGSIKTKACNKYTVNGSTYTNSGNYTQHLTNKAGCDSTLTLNLTILKSSASNIKKTACNDYTMNGKTFTSTGIYTQTIMNNVSCDSVITLDLTINKSSVFSFDKEACSSFTLNSITYNKSGIYSQTIPNNKGCDSTITLNLTINNSASSLKVTACQNYILNNQTYTESGIFIQTIPNAKGCDSSITLDLTLNKVITTITRTGATLTADANGAAYQWLDCKKAYTPILGEIYQNYTPTKTGDYAVEVTQNTCTDTSICYKVDLGNIDFRTTNSFQITPNPTNGIANIIFTNPLKNGSLKLFNTSGQIILDRSNLTGHSFSIDISDKANGIYFIEIREGVKVSRAKLIKD